MNYFAQFQQLTIFRICFVLIFSKIFEIAFKSRYEVYQNTGGPFSFGLLSFLAYEVLICLLAFLMDWSIPHQYAWVLILYTIIGYGVVVGFHYL